LHPIVIFIQGSLIKVTKKQQVNSSIVYVIPCKITCGIEGLVDRMENVMASRLTVSKINVGITR